MLNWKLDGLKTAKLPLGIESATVKSLTSVCATGEKQTERNLVSKLESGATESWRTLTLKKSLRLGRWNQKSQSELTISAAQKFLPLMVANNARAAVSLKLCFCRLITFTTTALKSASQAPTKAQALVFTNGFGKTNFRLATKSCA